jgi:hypothetical protein
MKLHIMQFSPASYNVRPLGSGSSHQHPVLKHPQSVFFLYSRTAYLNYHYSLCFGTEEINCILHCVLL